MNKRHLLLAALLEGAGILGFLLGLRWKGDPETRTLGFVLMGLGGFLFATAQAWILMIVLGPKRDREE